MVTLLEKYRGAMVGVHVGDSIGAPYETWSKQKIKKDMDKRGGLTFFDYQNPWMGDGNEEILPAGRPTDDSDQTADLAFSLIACDGLDVHHLHNALQDSVLHGKSRLWSGKATGSGRTTRNALSNDAYTSKLSGVPMNKIGTNGSLMRSTPLALWTFNKKLHIYGRSPEGSRKLYQTVEHMSAVTHTNPHSIEACYIYTIIMHQLLAGTGVLLSDAFASRTGIMDRLVSTLNDKYYFPIDPGAWPARGLAEFSLYTAMFALRHARSFAEGIEMAVTIGGDTDTYGAIAGGLLGAKFGYESIPEEWRKAILGHDQMVTYAEAIYNR